MENYRPLLLDARGHAFKIAAHELLISDMLSFINVSGSVNVTSSFMTKKTGFSIWLQFYVSSKYS